MITCIYAVVSKHDCTPIAAGTLLVAMLGNCPVIPLLKKILCSKLLPNLSLSANSVTSNSAGKDEKNKVPFSYNYSYAGAWYETKTTNNK